MFEFLKKKQPGKNKSVYVERMDLIQQEIDGFLKPLGFKKRGRTYHRVTEAGLTHVINLQMGSYEFGVPDIPGYRKNMYGFFAVNLGVFLLCLHEIEREKPIKHIKDYDCHIRERLGVLAHGEDVWIKLGKNTTKIAKQVIEEIEQYGLAFLDSFCSYDDVLEYFEEFNRMPFSNENRSKLQAAIILFHQGKVAKAFEYMDRIIETQEEDAWTKRSFKRYVKHLKSKLQKQLSEE